MILYAIKDSMYYLHLNKNIVIKVNHYISLTNDKLSLVMYQIIYSKIFFTNTQIMTNVNKINIIKGNQLKISNKTHT